MTMSAEDMTLYTDTDGVEEIVSPLLSESEEETDIRARETAEAAPAAPAPRGFSRDELHVLAFKKTAFGIVEEPLTVSRQELENYRKVAAMLETVRFRQTFHGGKRHRLLTVSGAAEAHIYALKHPDEMKTLIEAMRREEARHVELHHVISLLRVPQHRWRKPKPLGH